MSYKSYVLNKHTLGSVLTWTEKGKRCWAWKDTGTRYVVSCPRGDGSRLNQPSRFGGRRLVWVFSNCYVSVVDVDEVPEAVRAEMADSGSRAVVV